MRQLRIKHLESRSTDQASRVLAFAELALALVLLALDSVLSQFIPGEEGWVVLVVGGRVQGPGYKFDCHNSDLKFPSWSDRLDVSNLLPVGYNSLEQVYFLPT